MKTSFEENMKLILNSILICATIELIPFADALPARTNPHLKSLYETYDNGMQMIAEEFCEKFKNVSEKLLADKNVKEASTPELKELQTSLQIFLSDYPLFKKYKMEQPLLYILLDLVNLEENLTADGNLDSKQKFQLTMKKYFALPLQEYKQNHEKFVREKLIPKIEDYKKHSNSGDFQKLVDIKQKFDSLNSCQNYECLPSRQHLLIKNGSKEILEIFIHLIVDRMSFLLNVYDYNECKQLLKDGKFSQINLEVRNQITNDINKFITQFENHSNISEFIYLSHRNLNYLFKDKKEYIEKLKVSPEDSEILNEIIDNYNIDNNQKSKFVLSILDAIKLYERQTSFIAFIDPDITRF
ncbi:uncharacterized protein ACRADG_005518 [Cochliomyia hominivorax]